MANHKVLVPLDGSEFASQILAHVREFFQPGEDELVLLRVGESPEGVRTEAERPPPAPTMEPMPPYAHQEPLRKRGSDTQFSEDPIYTTQVEESVRHELEDQLRREGRELTEAGYAVRPEVRFGDPAKQIIQVAEDEEVALIAMTTHCRSGVREILLGSVAKQVIRHASVPVMLVRPLEKPADKWTP